MVARKSACHILECLKLVKPIFWGQFLYATEQGRKYSTLYCSAVGVGKLSLSAYSTVQYKHYNNDFVTKFDK